jgi:hypothetical protein
MPAPRITDRDRRLICLLSAARYLSTTQVVRLVFFGLSDSVYSGRLNRLASDGNPHDAFLRRLTYRTYDGKLVVVWALTPRGYRIAEELLGWVPKIPRRDVGASFLEHTVTLNELFVALAIADHGWSLAPASFRWLPTDSAGLPFTEFARSQMKERDRVIQPDATLELRAARRRIFLECEMGTHSIVKANDDAGGATLTKVRRYERFLTGRPNREDGQTFYATTFPDGFAPELVFLVHSAARRANVEAALARRRNGAVPPPFSIQAWTLEDAVRELKPTLRSARSPELASAAAAPSRPSAPIAAPSPPADGVFLPRAEVRALLRFYDEAIATIQGVRHKLRDLAKAGQRLPLAEPPYPASVQDVYELVQRLAGKRAESARR